MIKYIVPAIALLMVTGCTTVPVAPKENPASIVHLNLERLPPLDLTKYKAIQHQTIDANSQKYSCVVESDIEVQQELWTVLDARIEQQASQLEKYRNFYEPVQK